MSEYLFCFRAFDGSSCIAFGIYFSSFAEVDRRCWCTKDPRFCCVIVWKMALAWLKFNLFFWRHGVFLCIWANIVTGVIGLVKPSSYGNWFLLRGNEKLMLFIDYHLGFCKIFEGVGKDKNLHFSGYFWALTSVHCLSWYEVYVRLGQFFFFSFRKVKRPRSS